MKEKAFNIPRNPTMPQPWFSLLSLLLVLHGLPLPAQPAERAGTGGKNDQGADWGHWRGPARIDVVAENSRWNKGAWPPGPPKWTSSVGEGASSPLIVRGRVFVTGWKARKDNVISLDVDTGKELWRSSYPSPRYGRHSTGDKGFYGGPSATPEYDTETGFLYTLGIDGQLNCWDTRNRGRRVWGINLYDRYQMPQRPPVRRSGKRDYGYTTAPLLHRNWLIVQAGRNAGNLVAFDKSTGHQAWASEYRGFAGHAGGLAPLRVQGIPCVAALTLSNLIVVRLDKGHEGKTLAVYPYETDYANSIPSPTVYRDSIIFTSAYNHRTMTRLRVTLRGIEKVWETRAASGVCTPVIYKGYIYWAWKGIYCVRFQDGRMIWSGPGRGAAGSCIATTDDRIIAWVNKGDLLLFNAARISPKAFNLLSKSRVFARADAWPHVALAKGKLVLKDRLGNIACYDLDAHKARGTSSAATKAPRGTGK